MSLTYAQYTTTMANLAVYDETDPDFVQIMPQTIAYAENRIYRELDLLSTMVRDSSATLIANSRNFVLPSTLGQFSIVDGINVITPVGASVSTGTRNPLTPSGRDSLDRGWPSETAPSASTVPVYFSPVTMTQGGSMTVIVAPPPGAAYSVEVIGTITPTPLSASNTTTYLSTELPDLFVAASMVFMSGFMRNYSAGSDDPKMAQSWEAQYQSLKSSVDLVNAQAQFASAGWTSKTPQPIAASPR